MVKWVVVLEVSVVCVVCESEEKSFFVSRRQQVVFVLGGTQMQARKLSPEEWEHSKALHKKLPSKAAVDACFDRLKASYEANYDEKVSFEFFLVFLVGFLSREKIFFCFFCLFFQFEDPKAPYEVSHFYQFLGGSRSCITCKLQKLCFTEHYVY